MAAFSLWYGKRPADADHPYGHGKIAYFSAGVEGSLILIAAGGIFASALHAFRVGAAPISLGTGTLIMAALAAINLILGSLLIVIGRKHREMILIANGQHLLSDMLTSISVVMGVLMVQWTGYSWLDPAVALLVGVQVLLMGLLLMRRAYNGLMEKADPVKTEMLRQLLSGAVSTGRLQDWHQLRHRAIDNDLWIEVHLIFSGTETVAEAHHIATGIEDEIRALFPKERVRITTHLEPAGHDDDHPPGHPDHRNPEEEALKF
jgi:cation diffusion facilitator family transporter